MAVGKKKKNKKEIDKNRRRQTNLFEFAAKNKEKRKKLVNFAVDTFWRENILPRFFLLLL